MRPKTTKNQPRGSQKKSLARALDALTAAEREDGSQDTSKSSRRMEGDGGGKGKGKGQSRLAPVNDSCEDEDPPYADPNAPNAEEGSDGEGNRWVIGRVASDDDSELDSDEAFGESDEERFAEFTFRGSSTRTKRSGAAEEEEEDSQEEEDDMAEEEGGEDLLQLLDRRIREEAEGGAMVRKGSGGAQEGKGRKRKMGELAGEEGDENLSEVGGGEVSDEIGSGSGSGDGDSSEDYGSSEEEDDSLDEDEDSDMSGLSDSDDEPADPAKLSALHTIISSLPTTTKSDTAPKAKRPRLQDPNERRAPSEYNITNTSQKLTLADLLPTLDTSLKSSLKPLLKDSGPTTTGSIPGKLTAPLPKRQQDRIDRSIAYQKAKEELDKWKDTVKHNREAQHLHFPLPDPNANAAPGGADTRLPSTVTSAPLTELETTISGILKESHLTSEKELVEFESLKTKKLGVEEEVLRREQLLMARELLYRQEVRAKRIKKIKSKNYRRIHRKKISPKQALGAEEDGVMNAEEIEEMERRRAEERMTLKHKQSRWAKGLKESGRGMWDEEARDDVIEMVRRGEELKKRILGKKVNAGSGSEDDESEKSDIEEDMFDEEGQQRRKLLKELERIEQDGLDDGEETSMGRLMQMKFMQKAETGRKKANEEAMIRLREDLELEEKGSQADSDKEAEEEEEEAVSGRRIFKPVEKKGKQNKAKQKENVQVVEDGHGIGPDDEETCEEEEEEELELIINTDKDKTPPQPSTVHRGMPSKKPITNRSTFGKSPLSPPLEPLPVNRWTTMATDGARKLKPTASTATFASSASKTAKANAKLNKEKQAVLHTEQDTRGGLAGEDVLVDLDGAALLIAPPITVRTKVKIRNHEKSPASERNTALENNSATLDTSENESDSDSESETQITLIPSHGKANSLEIQHRDLAHKAFASEDVEAEFEDEKAKEVEADETKVIDETLPGWGSWSGAGINEKRKQLQREKSKTKKGRFVKVIQGIDKNKRRDAGLSKVIICEKAAKKVGLLSSLKAIIN